MEALTTRDGRQTTRLDDRGRPSDDASTSSRRFWTTVGRRGLTTFWRRERVAKTSLDNRQTKTIWGTMPIARRQQLVVRRLVSIVVVDDLEGHSRDSQTSESTSACSLFMVYHGSREIELSVGVTRVGLHPALQIRPSTSSSRSEVCT